MLERFLHWMGLGLCHQLPERSFFGGGIQVPVCARDTGIYLGFVAAFILLAIVHRGRRTRGFPGLHVWVVMGVFLAAMAWDGFSSYLGFRETTNTLRLLTGLGVGISVAAVIYPMLQDELWRTADSSAVLDPVWRFVTWLALLPVVYALVWWGGPLLGIAYPVLVAVCIVFTLAAINLVIVSMFPAFDRRAERLVQLWLPISIAVALAFVEIAAASALRMFVDGLL